MNKKPNKFKSHIKKVQAIEQNRINQLKQEKVARFLVNLKVWFSIDKVLPELIS